MAASFAKPTDVEAIWEKTLTTTQTVMVEARLVQASAIIREEVGVIGGLTVDERAAASPSFTELVRGVARDMVVRLLLNPGGRRQVAIDDSNVTYDAAISSGQIYLSDTEYRSLVGGRRLVDGDAATGAFTIRPAYTTDRASLPDTWDTLWPATWQ